MRKNLLYGQFQLDILDENESVLKFVSPEEAHDYLARFKGEDSALRIFRKLLSDDFGASDLPEADVLSQMAVHLANGKYKLLRTRLPLSTNTKEEEEQTPAQNKSAAPRKTSWIEIHLRDSSGQPVGGEKYRIKLPDGSTQEGSLDAYGHAEYYGINPGTCQVSFPNLEDDSWEQISR